MAIRASPKRPRVSQRQSRKAPITSTTVSQNRLRCMASLPTSSPKMRAVSVLRPLVPLINFCWPLKKLKNTSKAAWVRIEK